MFQGAGSILRVCATAFSTTSAAKMAIGAAANSEPLKPFFSSLDNSFTRELMEDPESSDRYPNQVTRPVKAGHFVRVAPTPLLKPYVVAFSNSMLENLNIPTTNSVVSSDDFVDLFSGNVEHFKDIKAWCTPYAVSVYGHPIMEPDQFRGYGYGDGRACSIGEVLGADGKRWEIQIKGSGQTRFRDKVMEEQSSALRFANSWLLKLWLLWEFQPLVALRLLPVKLRQCHARGTVKVQTTNSTIFLQIT